MSDQRIVESGGNVFADLGLPDADETLAKADLAREIVRLIQRNGWKQARAAKELGIDQPKVSALMRGRLEGFSTERLIRFLIALGQEVEIAVRPPKMPEQAGIRVSVENIPGKGEPIQELAKTRRIIPAREATAIETPS